MRLLLTLWPVSWSMLGNQKPVPVNEFVPVVLVDAEGKTVYRRLVRVGRDLPPMVYLPKLAKAVAVVVDPLGAWPEVVKKETGKNYCPTKLAPNQRV
ncbi:hypothetical protein [Spirosoma aerolatum]|uniref:hypothetical protein n=1 Tax=Spirosoma aerolatum TaxID=1211326 RepID=UPI0012D2BAD4|nr:hypothetical protein [Spirosoma aerolatum]